MPDDRNPIVAGKPFRPTEGGIYVDYLLESTSGLIPIAVCRGWFPSWNTFLELRQTLRDLGLVKIPDGFYVQPFDDPPHSDHQDDLDILKDFGSEENDDGA